MSAASKMEHCKWRDYRGSEHAWSSVRDLGMQRSRCGYLARNVQVTAPTGRRCVLCVCMMDKSFATAPRAGRSDATTRLADVRRIRDHVRRAVQALRATSLNLTVSQEALAKLGAVEADLVKLFRLERAGTSETADDETLG